MEVRSLWKSGPRGSPGFVEVPDLENRKVGKRRVPTNPWDPSYQILKILNMGSRSSKNMKWKCCPLQLNWGNLNNWISFFQLKESPHPGQCQLQPMRQHLYDERVNFYFLFIIQNCLCEGMPPCLRRAYGPTTLRQMGFNNNAKLQRLNDRCATQFQSDWRASNNLPEYSNSPFAIFSACFACALAIIIWVSFFFL